MQHLPDSGFHKCGPRDASRDVSRDASRSVCAPHHFSRHNVFRP